MDFSNFKIGTRLYAGFGTVLAITVALLVMAYSNFTQLREANRWNAHTYKVMEEVDAMLTALINIETGERGFALTGQDASLDPYHKGKQEFEKHWQQAKKLTSDNRTQQERLDQLAQLEKDWMGQAIEPTIALRRAVIAGTQNMDAVVISMQAGKGKQSMDAMRALMTSIRDAESSLLAQREADATALADRMMYTLLFGGLLVTLFGLTLAVWLTRNIVKPVTEAVALAGRVASGDLTVSVRSRSGDEIGELLNALGNMTQSLSSTVSGVRSASDMIATASSQIAAGNADLSSRTEQQASSLEETASSMEELTSTVKQNADNARQANQLAGTASQVAVKGGEVVSEVVNTMSAINQSSAKIADIISVIDGIAFQTNILALNAAVEAARAGEQGRGFAVVATEVRNLAQRSANAAKEIKTLIDDSVQKVSAGTALVSQAGATMTEVVNSVRRVTDVMAEIQAASQEQSAGIEQVNQAVGQMDQVTQQNAALVEQAAAAAESLQEQAAKLAEAVSVFKVDGAVPVKSMGVSRQVATLDQPMRPAAPVKKPVRAVRHPANQPAVTAQENWEEF